MNRLLIWTLLIFFSSCNRQLDNKTTIRLNQADSLLFSKKFDESFHLYKSTFDEDTLNLKATYGCGLTSLKSGNSLEAKQYFDRYLAKKQDANAFLYRGVSYDNLGSIQEAMLDYSKAIELDPDNAIAYNNRGSIKIVKFKMYDEGIKDISTALKIDSNQPACYDNIGLAYDYQGNYKEAERYYGIAISMDPTNSGYYFNRGAANINLRNFESALADLNQAIAIDSLNGLFYKNRAIVYYNLHNQDKTCEDLQRAVFFNDFSSKEYLEKLCDKTNKISK